MYLGPKELHRWVELALPLRNKKEQKHWVSKCLFFLFICIVCFGFLMWHMIRSCQSMQNSCSESFNSLRIHFPWFHGAAVGRCPRACAASPDGYFYIYLPPIFMCLLYVLLFSLTKNTWPHSSSPAVVHRWLRSYLHAAVGGRIMGRFQSD